MPVKRGVSAKKKREVPTAEVAQVKISSGASSPKGGASGPIPSPGAENGHNGEVLQNGKAKYLGRDKHRRSSDASTGSSVCSVPIDPKTAMFFETIRDGNVPKLKSLMRGKNLDMNTRDLNDPTHPTALLAACFTNNTEVVKLMLTAKKARTIDVNQEDLCGRRPIWVAALKGNPEIAELLLYSKGAECDVNFIDKESGCSPLYRAIMSNSESVARILINAKADVNMRRLGYDLKAETPLIKAVQMDNIKICEHLINGLCKIQAKTEDGLNALHFAVAYRRYEIAELLMKSDINIHAKSNHGITPMTVAIEHRTPAMVRLLIEYGYKMDHRYKWKETPLSQAINLHSEESAMTLIHWGCSLQKKRGFSYFYMAVDEKLMRLAKFMVAINPQYLQEEWIRLERWPVSIFHRPDIWHWLQNESKQVRKLGSLCRSKIFRLLGKYPTAKLKKLPLSEDLKGYLEFGKYVKEEFYTHHPLNVTGECPIDCPAICPRKYCPPIEVSSSSESESDTDDDEMPCRPISEHHKHKKSDLDAEKCCDYCR